MRLLVLRGTSFVGRAIAATAIDGGHDVTLFGRGRTGADLFPTLVRLASDRDSDDHASLAGFSWDAVVDVSGYVPRHVGAAGAVLDGAGRPVPVHLHHLRVRPGARHRHIRRARPRWSPERNPEVITESTYGPLMMACEDDVTARFGERATIVRPGIVAGPHDPTDRFAY